MPPVTMTDFTRQANQVAESDQDTTFLKVSEGKLTKTGFLGNLFTSQATRRETINVFVAGLREKYGDHIADMIGSAKLNSLRETGKPLTARLVRELDDRALLEKGRITVAAEKKADEKNKVNLNLTREVDEALKTENPDKLLWAIVSTDNVLMNHDKLFNEEEMDSLIAQRKKVGDAFEKTQGLFDKMTAELRHDLSEAVRGPKPSVFKNLLERVEAEIGTLQNRLGESSPDRCQYTEACLHELNSLKDSIELEINFQDLREKLEGPVTTIHTLSGLRREVEGAGGPDKTQKLKSIDAFSGAKIEELKGQLKPLADYIKPLQNASEEDISGRQADLERNLAGLEERSLKLLNAEDQKAFKDLLGKVRQDSRDASAANILTAKDGNLAKLSGSLTAPEQKTLGKLLSAGACHALLCQKLSELDVQGLQKLLNILAEAEKKPEDLAKALEAQNALDNLTLDSAALDETSLSIKLSLVRPEDNEITTDRHISARVKQQLFSHIKQNGGQALLDHYGLKSSSDLNMKTLPQMVRGLGSNDPSDFDILLAKTLWSEIVVEAKSKDKNLTPDIGNLRALLPAKLNEALPGEQLLKAFELGMPSMRGLYAIQERMKDASSALMDKSVLKLIENLGQDDDTLRARQALTAELRNMTYIVDQSFTVRDTKYVPDARYNELSGKWIAKAAGTADIAFSDELANFLGRFEDLRADLDGLQNRETGLNRLREAVEEEMATAQKEIHSVLVNQGAIDKNNNLDYKKVEGDTLSCGILGMNDILENGAYYGDSQARWAALSQFEVLVKVNLASMESSTYRINIFKTTDDDGAALISLLKGIQELKPEANDFEKNFQDAEKQLRNFLAKHKLVEKARYIVSAKGSTETQTLGFTGEDGKMVSVPISAGSSAKALEHGFDKALRDDKFRNLEVQNKIRFAMRRDYTALHGSRQRLAAHEIVLDKRHLDNLRVQEEHLKGLTKNFSKKVNTVLKEATGVALLRAFCEQSEHKKFADAEKALSRLSGEELFRQPLVAGAVEILVNDFGLDRNLAQVKVQERIIPAKTGPSLGKPVQVLSGIIGEMKPSREVRALKKEQWNALTSEERGRIVLEKGLAQTTNLLNDLEPGQVVALNKEWSLGAGVKANQGLEISLAAKAAHENGLSFARSSEGKYLISVSHNNSFGLGLAFGLEAGVLTATANVGAEGRLGGGLVLTFDSLDQCAAYTDKLLRGGGASDMAEHCSSMQTFNVLGGGVALGIKVEAALTLPGVGDIEPSLTLEGGMVMAAQGNISTIRDSSASTITVKSENKAQISFGATAGLDFGIVEPNEALEIVNAAGNKIEPGEHGKVSREESLNLEGAKVSASLSFNVNITKSVTRNERDGSLKEASVSHQMGFHGSNSLEKLLDFLGGPMAMKPSDAKATVEAVKSALGGEMGEDSSFTLTRTNSLTSAALGKIQTQEKIADDKGNSLEARKGAAKQARELMADKGSYGWSKLEFEIKMNENNLSKTYKAPPGVDNIVSFNFTRKTGLEQIQLIEVKRDNLAPLKQTG